MHEAAQGGGLEAVEGGSMVLQWFLYLYPFILLITLQISFQWEIK